MTPISNLAHVLGLSVTAEGIETRQQHDAVARVGCERAQGFLYSRAVPAEDILALLRTGLGAVPRPGLTGPHAQPVPVESGLGAA